MLDEGQQKKMRDTEKAKQESRERQTEQWRREQSERSGACVFVNVPRGFSIGVDYAKWTPKSDDLNIWCVSGILEGAHFITWTDTREETRDEDAGDDSCMREYEENSTKGVFIYLCSTEVVVFRWSPKKRAFLKVIDSEEIARFQIGHDKLTLKERMIVYPAEFIQPWRDITFAISTRTLDQIQGHLMNTYQELKTEYDNAASAKNQTKKALKIRTSGLTETTEEKKGEEDTDVEMGERVKIEEVRKTDESKPSSQTPSAFDESLLTMAGLRQFTDVPKQREVLSLSGAALTAAMMDRSKDLETLLAQLKNRMAAEGSDFVKRQADLLANQLGVSVEELLLLGELQFSYLTFLLDADVDAMDQWRALLILMSDSDCLVSERVSLGYEFVRALYGFVDQCPDDLLQSDITKSNFIIHSTLNFIDAAADTTDGKLAARTEHLEVRIAPTRPLERSKFYVGDCSMLVSSHNTTPLCMIRKRSVR